MPKCRRHVIVEKSVKSVIDDDGIQVGCFVGQMKVTCQAKNTHCSLLYTTLVVHFELRYATNFVYKLLDSPLSMQSFTKTSVLPYSGRLVTSSVKVYAVQYAAIIPRCKLRRHCSHCLAQDLAS